MNQETLEREKKKHKEGGRVGGGIALHEQKALSSVCCLSMQGRAVRGGRGGSASPWHQTFKRFKT